jgi:hypothetical protein
VDLPAHPHAHCPVHTAPCTLSLQLDYSFCCDVADPSAHLDAASHTAPCTPHPQLEYPSVWPTFFHDLIGAAGQGSGLVDMFCRVLISVDEDIISLEIPRWA